MIENIIDMMIIAQFQKLNDVRPCKVNVCKCRTDVALLYLRVKQTNNMTIRPVLSIQGMGLKKVMIKKKR